MNKIKNHLTDATVPSNSFVSFKAKSCKGYKMIELKRLPSQQINNSKIKMAAMAFALLVTIISGCGGGGEKGKTNIQTHLERSESYQQNHQYRAAMIEARNAIQLEPENPMGHIRVAAIYTELGQSKSAIMQLQMVKDVSSLKYNTALVNAYISRGKFASAWLILQQNKNLFSKIPEETALLTAQVQLGLGKLDIAARLYAEISAKTPENTNALYGQARISARKNDIARTEMLIDKILSIDATNGEALMMKARIALNGGKVDVAEEILNELLASLPTSDLMTPLMSTAYTSLARILTSQGRTNEALVYSKIMAKNFPKAQGISADMNSAISAYKGKDFQKAETILLGVLEKAPGHEAAGSLLGAIKFLQGNAEEANLYFNKYMDAEVADSSTIGAYALTQLKLNKPQNVIQLLEAEIETSTNTNTLALFGIASLSAGNNKQALQVLNKAIGLEPDNIQIMLLLANYFNLVTPREQLKALEYLQQSYKLSPADPYIQTSLITQYINLDQRENADKLIAQIENDYGDSVDSMVIVSTYHDLVGNNSKALDKINKALDIDATNITALQTRGAMLLRSRNYEAAVANYHSMIQSRPDLLIGYKGLLKSYQLLQNQLQGIVEIEKYTRSSEHLAPFEILLNFYADLRQLENASQILNLAEQKFAGDSKLENLNSRLALATGLVAFENNTYNEARVAAMNGLQLKPENIQLQELLIKIELATKNYKEARKLIDQLRLNNKNLATSLMGDLAVAENDLDAALTEFTSLWKQRPNEAIAQRIHQIYLLQDDKKAAAEFFIQWNKLYPNSGNALLVQSNQAIKEARFDDAIDALQKIMSRQQGNVSYIVLNNLAWAYQQTKQYAPALKYAEQAYKKQPTLASVADTYGWVLHLSGNSTKAREVLTQALEKSPENESIKGHLEQFDK